MSATPAQLAVVNDYALVGEGVRRFLEPFRDDIAVVAAVPTGAAVPAPVDIALYDTFGCTGIDLGHVRDLAAHPDVAAVAIYAFEADDDVVASVLDAGARGVVSKAMAGRQLANALRSIATGDEVVAGPTGVGRATREVRGWPGQELGLSEREAEVVALASLGHRNSEIATALRVSIDTVKTHLARSFRKLDLHNRTALAALVHTNPAFRRTAVAVA